MSLDLKALRREPGKVARTSLHLEHAFACPAAKVVVMTEVSELVPRRLSGQIDGSDRTVLDHEAQGTVHRGSTESRHCSSGR